MKSSLDTSVQYLKGIGPKRAKVLNKLGISTIEDLLYYFPRRYEDRSEFLSISQLKEGEFQTIKAQVLAKGERQSWRRRGFAISEIAAGDKTGKIFCVWFNQPYLKDHFKVGQNLVLYGKIERYAGRLQMNSPEFEVVSDEQGESLNIGRITPIYHLPKGLTQRYFRQLVKCALDEYLTEISDFLPYDIRSRSNLLNLARSLSNIHFPDNFQIRKEAYRRLCFEEFFLFQVPLALRKLKRKDRPGIAHRAEGVLAKRFLESLSFRLTPSQEKVIKEIKADMALPKPMHRLLQGDVGSGKTVVATLASLFAIEGGYQVALMVPTELLAQQHYEKIGSGLYKVKVALLIGSIDREGKSDIYKQIEEGKVNFVIGTHALLEEEVKFKNLGLVVIDEQHKFGVGQRALLPRKGLNPDVLIMTATPIPRTLAITLYADLDISVLTELPVGRLPVETMCFHKRQASGGYRIAKDQLRQGHQVYIVYPVIEESYALDMSGAKKMYEELKKGEFKDFRLGLIHGMLKQKEQNKVMSQFRDKKLDLLVATTVLEVGIDISNATCMLVEHAERFGLSQLHQLRGRVGRGAAESFCILVSNAQTPEAKARIEAMLKYSDGFRIAEQDLKIRGPGEFFGKRQSGLSELKIANPLTQMQLLKKAREEAIKLIDSDSRLEMRQNMLLKEKLLQRFPEYEKLVMVG